MCYQCYALSGQLVAARAAIERVIDDDGIPARPALPWLPIPSGLGHVVGVCRGEFQFIDVTGTRWT